jgi:FAD/FMN-containing dehydrogenase
MSFMTRHSFSLHRPGSASYARALDVFNGAIQARPDAVVVPADEAELAATLVAASRGGTSVSIRSGGHGIAGRAIQGEWVVDMRRFTRVRFSGSRVWAGAGLTWRQLDESCAPYGMAVPGGAVSSTGIGGLTLGGGVGWLLPQAGLTCDRLAAVSGVTGDGETVRIDDASDAETMAFLRGLGHGLLAVTEFEYEPVPIPRQISAGSLTYLLSDAREVIETLIGESAECTPLINWSPSLMWRGNSPVLSLDGASFDFTAFDTWAQEVCKVRPLGSNVRYRTYPEVQRMLDNPARWGRRSSWRSVFTAHLTSEAVGFLVESFYSAPSSGCQVFIERMTGAAKTPVRPSVFPLRWAEFDVLITAGWERLEDDQTHHDWLAATKTGLCELLQQSPDAGTYSNYADRAERIALLGGPMIEKLAEVRSRYDPVGIFEPCYLRGEAHPAPAYVQGGN